MLDQLVESKSNSKENARRGGFFLTTFVILIIGIVSAWGYSLFHHDYALNAGDLDLSALGAPVPVPDEAPPPPPEVKPDKPVKAAPNVDTRTEIIQRMDQTPVKPPDELKTTQNTVKPPREGVATRLGSTDNNALNAASSDYKGVGNRNGTGVTGSTGNDTKSSESGSGEGVPPPPPPPVKPPPPPVPKTVSKVALKGSATSLPQPTYPPAAKAVRAAGTVTVQVKIDENGNVVSASAVSGHPLLKTAAEQAARRAKFSPTKLSGQPVSVTGVITYNFIL